jgi:hypothetical protein
LARKTAGDLRLEDLRLIELGGDFLKPAREGFVFSNEAFAVFV